MEKRVMNKHRFTSSIICICLSLLVLSSCFSPWKWKYYSEEGVFKNRDDSLIIDFRQGVCVFFADGDYLDLTFGLSNELCHILFYSYASVDVSDYGITDNNILLYVDVDADKKAKTLTLTVTGGSLEQFLGNVYVLDFYPGEELKFDDPVETREGADNSGKIEG